MTTLPDAKAPISRIDTSMYSLLAAIATGPGSVKQFSAPVVNVSMQVSFTGGSPTVKVLLEGTINGVDWFTLATFDTGAAGASGNIVGGSTLAVMAARANLDTLSGGTNPTVTAAIVARGGV